LQAFPNYVGHIRASLHENNAPGRAPDSEAKLTVLHPKVRASNLNWGIPKDHPLHHPVYQRCKAAVRPEVTDLKPVLGRGGTCILCYFDPSAGRFRSDGFTPSHAPIDIKILIALSSLLDHNLSMLATVCSAAVNGIEAYPVEVEVNAGFGDTLIVMVVNNYRNRF
jgi:hypothetical protein